MKISKIKLVTPGQSSQINQLWNDEYPIKLKDRFLILLDETDNFNHYIGYYNRQFFKLHCHRTKN